MNVTRVDWTKLLTNVKFEVSDSAWPGVLKKRDPVLSALFKDGVLITSTKLGSVKRISFLERYIFSYSVYTV